MSTKKLFSVVYNDKDIIVLNKSSGLLVAQDRWNPDAQRLDLLVNEFINKESNEGQEKKRIYAVHRIDKDTSGLIIYAKTKEAHKNLSVMFEKRTVDKTYHCLVYGRPIEKEFSCNIPLRANGDSLHRTVQDKRKGKESITNFTLIGACGKYSWLEAKPITGRTHQIRVHLKLLELPIVCDPLYGSNEAIYLSKIKKRWKGDIFDERPLLNRLALHAYKLEFKHPRTNQLLSLKADYPKDLNATRNQLQKLYSVNPLEDD